MATKQRITRTSRLTVEGWEVTEYVGGVPVRRAVAPTLPEAQRLLK